MRESQEKILVLLRATHVGNKVHALCIGNIIYSVLKRKGNMLFNDPAIRLLLDLHLFSSCIQIYVSVYGRIMVSKRWFRAFGDENIYRTPGAHKKYNAFLAS